MDAAGKHIAVIGAGAWGTALAQVQAAAGRSVTLYARDPALANDINARHENAKWLSGIPLSPRIAATASLKSALAEADIALLVTPAQFLRPLLEEMGRHIASGTPLVNCAKGIEISTGALLSEIAAEVLPRNPYAVLSGPTFAEEVARGLPSALTFASTAPRDKAAVWAEILSSKTFRPYLSPDPVGAEIAGALKNVIAIACGVVEGKALGQNARSAVMTRGLAEIRRFGARRQARAETFMGLSGIGDLTLTCHSMQSRNFSMGVALGRGRRYADVAAERKTVTEGVSTARAVAALARKEDIDMPICLAVNAILHEGAPVDDVVAALLSRNLKDEEA